jgi:hypothetical protein
MKLGWETRPLSIVQHARDWHDRSQSNAGPSSSTGPPSFAPVSLLSQRRRSSAAHVPPAGPPPNQPIPSIPPTVPVESPVTATADYYFSQSHINGNESSSNIFGRPSASPNLTAVAAFSQSRPGPSWNHVPAIDNLSDPPPVSMLPSASSRALTQHQDIVPDRLLLSPPVDPPRLVAESRPSSRRALTRALELAREAVKLDSTNNDPFGAVIAYGRSVALLSEVMERVRRGEDSTESHRKRNGRRRSVVAQEEEVRRLKSIVSNDPFANAQRHF